MGDCVDMFYQGPWSGLCKHCLMPVNSTFDRFCTRDEGLSKRPQGASEAGDAGQLCSVRHSRLDVLPG